MNRRTLLGAILLYRAGKRRGEAAAKAKRPEAPRQRTPVKYDRLNRINLWIFLAVLAATLLVLFLTRP